MNTVERVARAINHYVIERSKGPFMSIEVTRLTQFDAAKAALNALADGLEWEGDRLFLNEIAIGAVSKAFTGNWVGYLGLTSHLYCVNKRKYRAKKALMAAARKWLIGE